ncbi:OsmC family protein [Nocardioides dongkuii]|uniref:OsmC family protein n=1 Tax=Nocardioides dongkuii TaxID=2760089 RepID=UPI0015F96109|nr:OsmC family protein [Nocardioides dongkuii]
MSDAPRTPETHRSVDVRRTGDLTFEAVNARGGTLPMGSGDDPTFTPVELLLAALAGCGAIDLEHLTGKRAPFASFAARSEGHKVRDEHGNHLVDLRVTFDVTFPEGADGDRAREVLPRSLEQIEGRLCSVGRTVQVGDPVRYVAGPVAD